MAKRKNKTAKPKPKRTRITAKAVERAEAISVSVTLPQVDVKAEIDLDPWGPDGLTVKQRRFCQAYVSEAAGNATKAAQLAGYRDDNLASLAQTAWENLRKPELRSFIGRLLAIQGMDRDFLKSRLAELARSSLDNFSVLDESGEVVLDLKRAATMGALGQVKEIREESIELGNNLIKRKRTIKIHDPQPSIRTLLEMHGAIVHRHEVTGADGGPVKTEVTQIINDPRSLELANALARRMAVNAGGDGESAN